MPVILHPETGMSDLPVKSAKLYILKDKLKIFKMQEGESIPEMFHRLQVIVNDLKSLGEKVNDEDVSYRFLRCLPPRFKTLVTIILRGGLKDVTPNQVLGDVMKVETYHMNDKLNKKLTNFKMQEGESIPGMFHRLQVIVNDLKNLGEKVNDEYVSHKFLRCLPPRFEALVTMIRIGGLKDVTPNQVLGDVMREETYHMKDRLNKKLTSFKMQEGESIPEMFNRLQVIVNDLKSLGKKVNDEDVSYRFLRCLPPRFKTLVFLIVRGGLKGVTPHQVLGDVMTEEAYHVEREGGDQGGENKKSVPFRATTSSPKSKGKKKKEDSNEDEGLSSNDEDDEEMAFFLRRFEKFTKKGYDARRRNLSSKGKEKRCFKCKSKDHLIADCAYNSDDEKNVKKEKDKESKKMILKKGHSYCVTWDSDASSSDDDDWKTSKKKAVIAINTKPSYMMLHGQGL